MKQILYSGATFQVSDAVADALLTLVTALGRTESTMNVTIPTHPAGEDEPQPVAIVIGPSSEIAATPSPYPRGEPSDADAVAELQRFARTLGTASAVPFDPSELGDDAFLPDEL